MALIIFKDLPDVSTPINATNLNTNFKEINNALTPANVNINDFLTVNSGFSINHFNVLKIGKKYIGTINVTSDDVFNNSNSVPFILKNKPIVQQSTYTFCGLGTRDWEIKGIGYCFLGSDGSVIIVDQNNVGTYKSASININYVAQ